MSTIHELQIYGASDDLIEIEGEITDELGCYGQADEDDSLCVAVSDGTLLRVLYDADGCWRFTQIAQGAATLTKKEAIPDTDDYSDRVTLQSPEPFKWVALSEKVAKR